MAILSRHVLRWMRPLLLAVLIGIAGAGCNSNGSGTAAPSVDGTNPPAFDLNGNRFPVLFAGDAITVSKDVTGIEYFKPLFGRDRPEVNPGIPVVEDGTRVRFPLPGEYYLRFNNGWKSLKVLVLSPDEPISASVLRLFDFCVANMLYSGMEDVFWYKKWDEYIDDWFQSTAPAMLSCGPTNAVFRRLIEERFSLPVRTVTYPGTFYYEDPNGNRSPVVYATHNMAEVYLPDLGKFVVFDVNDSFVPLWLDALELAKAASGVLGEAMVSVDGWKAIGLNVHHNVTSYGCVQPIPLEPIPFSEALVSPVDTAVVWPSLLQGLAGGVAYWGTHVDWVKPTGTEFLPGDYLFASLHRDPILESAAIAWVESFSLEVTIIAPEVLRSLLEEGRRTAAGTMGRFQNGPME